MKPGWEKPSPKTTTNLGQNQKNDQKQKKNWKMIIPVNCQTDSSRR